MRIKIVRVVFFSFFGPCAGKFLELVNGEIFFFLPETILTYQALNFCAVQLTYFHGNISGSLDVISFLSSYYAHTFLRPDAMAETAKRPYLIFYRADISQIYRRYSPTKNTYLHVGLVKGTLRIKV